MIYFENTEKYFILNPPEAPNIIPIYNYDSSFKGFNFGETEFYEKSKLGGKIPLKDLESYLVLFSEDDPLTELDRFVLGKSENLFEIVNDRVILDISYDELLAYKADDFVYLWYVEYKNIKRVILQGTSRLY